jgi:hypothetical protein
VGKFSSGPGRVVGETTVQGYIRKFLDQISLDVKLMGWDSDFAQERLWNAGMVNESDLR